MRQLVPFPECKIRKKNPKTNGSNFLNFSKLRCGLFDEVGVSICFCRCRFTAAVSQGRLLTSHGVTPRPMSVYDVAQKNAAFKDHMPEWI